MRLVRGIQRGFGLFKVKHVLLCAILVLIFCEYVIYPLVLSQCSWPYLQKSQSSAPLLKTMFVADPHLLGPFRGHWFDKLRREWQMHRTFQTALTLFTPEVVFFLGDVFDEGEWVNAKGFHEYKLRFESLFEVRPGTMLEVVAGNHDIGFHYKTSPLAHQRFKDAFNASAVRLLSIRGINFVLVNSMAMEMDSCFLCQEGLRQLDAVERNISCLRNPVSCSLPIGNDYTFAQPILLQHFPLFRPSDKDCLGEDSAPDSEKLIPFRLSIDCLSLESSKVILKKIQPRLILSGHTHHFCIRNHSIDEGSVVSEISVPSFSWRNRNDPSFYLNVENTITPEEFSGDGAWIAIACECPN